MKKEIKEIIEATSMGKLEKKAVIESLLNLHSVSKKELKEKLQIEFDKGHYKGTQSTGYSF
jgi:hypothetical protein